MHKPKRRILPSGRVIEMASPDDPIYQEDWTIGLGIYFSQLSTDGKTEPSTTPELGAAHGATEQESPELSRNKRRDIKGREP